MSHNDMALHRYVADEILKLMEGDPEAILDEFDITCDDLLKAFYMRITRKLKEQYNNDNEDEEGEEE